MNTRPRILRPKANHQGLQVRNLLMAPQIWGELDSSFSQTFRNFLPNTYSNQQRLLHKEAKQLSLKEEEEPLVGHKVNYIPHWDPEKTFSDISQFYSSFSLSKRSSICDKSKQS